MSLTQASTGNLLLRGLSKSDFVLLEPLLVITDLPLRKVLESRGRRIENVYFPETGIVSVVVNAADNQSIEAGIIGREGATGLGLFHGAEVSAFDTYMQVAGSGWRLSATNLKSSLDKSPTLRAHLALFGHVFLVQLAHTILANGRYKIDERLARWLLMTLDRVEGNVLTLTHEFLALMLGVRRPGVTAALNILKQKEVISTSRGYITVINKEALREVANGSYGAPEAEFDKYLATVAV